MARPILTDAIWDRIAPLLRRAESTGGAGRPRVPDRNALTGILFVLKTGIAWEELPYELGCGAGMTCLRRLRHWQDCGVWPEISRILKEELDGTGGLDWARAGQRRRVEAAGWTTAGRNRRTGPQPGRRGGLKGEDGGRGTCADREGSCSGRTDW